MCAYNSQCYIILRITTIKNVIMLRVEKKIEEDSRKCKLLTFESNIIFAYYFEKKNERDCSFRVKCIS